MATILVIDDGGDSLDVLGRYVTALGHTAHLARDGAEGLAALTTGLVPDLVILDLEMPVMTGREFLTARGADPRWAAIPVLVRTAAVVRGPVAGASVVVGKGDPFTILLAARGRVVPVAATWHALAVSTAP